MNLEHLIDYLKRHGLATPTLLALHCLRPLSFLGSQLLILIQPLAPHAEWQQRIGRTASTIEDEATWTRLENLLQ